MDTLWRSANKDHNFQTIQAVTLQLQSLIMGVATGVAGAAFAAPILLVGITNTACHTNKIRGQNTNKMFQKRNKIHAKNT